MPEPQGSVSRIPLFGAAVAALLVLMGVAQVTSAIQETQTWDEGIHLLAGYTYWRTGDYSLNREHPPLFKLLCALPLLALNPSIPVDAPAWKRGDTLEITDLFLYQNRVGVDRMLLVGRLMTIAVTLLLGLLMALWARRRFGEPAALAALFLFAFDPNMIAHGRYVTNDVMAAAGVFLSVITWARWIETRRWRDLVLAGVVFGLALTTKFSVAFLPLPLAVLYWFRRWQEGRGRLSLRHFAAGVVLAGVLAAGVIAVVYGPATIQSLHGPKLGRAINWSTRLGATLGWVGKRLGLPAHPFLLGLVSVAAHDQGGHPAYLMGAVSEKGWWYYFPVVFALKTPAATLALLAIAVAVGLFALARAGPRGWSLRRIPFEWVVVTVPALVYFAFAMASQINLGVRHILPIYPFLFVALGAAAMQTKWSRRALPVLLLVLAIESAAIYPHYLSFFNLFAGVAANGPKYLVDSNADWGQDIKHLKIYLDKNRIDKLCICYFGRASLGYYGIDNYKDVPTTEEMRKGAQPDCVAAVSATPLEGPYVGLETFRWLRERQPMAKVGYSIYLYDLRRGKALGNSGDLPYVDPNR